LPESPSQERSACPPERPGDAHVRPFGRSGPPRGACGAARHRRTHRRFPGEGRSVRAAASSSGWHGFSPWELQLASPRRDTEITRGWPSSAARPPAPIGWGSLTGRANLWRPLSHGSPERAASFAAPRRAPLALLAECAELHRARPAGDRRRFRATASERTRTPSIGSTWALRPGRAGRRSLFTFALLPRTLSPAVSHAEPRQRPAGRFRLSPCEHEERCVSPTSATDLRPRAPSTDHPIPEHALVPRGCPLRDPRWASLAGGPRRPLAGSLPQPAPACLRSLDLQQAPGWSVAWRRPSSFRLRPRPCPARVRGLDPELASKRAPRGPGGAAIDSSSALCAGPRLCRPRTRLVTWLLTPSVAARRRGPPSREKNGPRPPCRQARRHRRLVKDSGFRRTRAPSVAEISLRSACSTLARSAGLRLMGSPALPDGIAAARTRGLAAACMRPLSTGPATSPRSGALARAETHGRLKRATTLLHPFARGKSPSANAEPRRKVALPCVGRGG